MLNPFKNMDIGQIRELIKEAKKYERQLEEKIKSIIEQEKQKGGLVRRAEFEALQKRVEELERRL